MARLPLRELTSPTYIRYGLGSVVALGADMGLFIMLLHLGTAPIPASATAYMLGVLVHWLISSRLVFTSAAAPRGPARRRQKGLFLGSALLGLAITTAIVALGGLVGLLPVVAKLIAIAVSFQATYVVRRTMVFAS